RAVRRARRHERPARRVRRRLVARHGDRRAPGVPARITSFHARSRKAAIEAVRKLNPACSFPTIIIDGKIIVGFKENEIREALGI
ncbi:MAG: hypothetical protein R6U13_08400, partial [Desulfatiglandaceae bacterium]